ncbi:MAG TPA: glycosyltransferase, partial [Geminicoccaceae bacterium]|nr:glycosyltransferase [Geminicoccaceae bacterium]
APWGEIVVDGVRVRSFTHYPLQPFHHALARAELAAWLRDGADGADLLHVHLPLLPPLPTDLPVVATFHSPMLHDTGAIAEPGLRPALIKANARLFSRRYEQWYLDRAAAVVAVSQAVRAELEMSYRSGNRRPIVVPNGVDTDFFGFAPLSGRTSTVLYVGRLGYRKGLSRLLKAFTLLPRELGLELTLAGEGPLEPALERHAATLGVSARVRFTGFLDRAAVRAELQAATCFVNPADYESGPLDAARGDGLRRAGGEHGHRPRHRDGSPGAAAPQSVRAGGAGHGDRGRRPDRPAGGRGPGARGPFDGRGPVRLGPGRRPARSALRRPAGARRVIQLRPRQRPALRLAVVCPGFAAERARRQPWHVADGIARGAAALGHEVRLFTDSAGLQPATVPYTVEPVGPLLSAGRASGELLAGFGRAPVDHVFLVTGASMMARLRRLDLGAPVSLVVASPRLRVSELLRLGPLHLWRERGLLALPLLNALLPGFVLRRGLRRSGAVDVVYLSAAARERFGALGLPPGRLLLPQVDGSALLPPPLPPRGGPFRVAYFGPPLATRGADLALLAFERAVARGLDGRLLLLLRPDSGRASLSRLQGLVERSPERHRIDCRVDMLPPEELRRELAGADAFLLPFRATVSEVPLVVIEAGLSGGPTIVLDAPGVGEIARRLGGIVAPSPDALPDALLQAAAGPTVVPKNARYWTDWPAAVAD